MTDERGVQNRRLSASDVEAVSALNAAVFGPGRFARTAYRVREGTPAISPFCRAAFVGDTAIASLRLTPITIGESGPHLLLGPLAVASRFAGLGYGQALVWDALSEAKLAGIGVVTLVGDLPYYERFGFAMAKPGSILFPGPVNPARILVCELTPGTRADAVGMVASDPYLD